jgi:hypothetical protein
LKSSILAIVASFISRQLGKGKRYIALRFLKGRGGGGEGEVLYVVKTNILLHIHMSTEKTLQQLLKNCLLDCIIGNVREGRGSKERR